MHTHSNVPTLARFLLALTVVVGSTLALVGCDTVGTSPSASNDGGQLTVKLTDAPGDILEAHVTIERVSIVPTEVSSTGGAAEGGIKVLADKSMTVDLVQLQNGVTETLGQIDIPEGSYGQIRFVTAREATVYYEDANGQKKQAELMLPSADQTGIKINFEEFTIDDTEDTVEITLDFNVQESFVKAGQSGTYIFKPVVKAKSVVTNGSAAGSSN